MLCNKFYVFQQVGEENKKWHYQVDIEKPKGKSYFLFFLKVTCFRVLLMLKNTSTVDAFLFNFGAMGKAFNLKLGRRFGLTVLEQNEH